MKNKTFCLGTWEMHLQTKNEQKLILNKMKNVCKYIDTAIDYNNDYLLRNIEDYILISKISSYHNDDYEFFVSNHLKCLNRSYIDIMLIHSNRGNWQSLLKKMKNDKRFKEIGVSNFNIQEILEYKEIVGEFPKYNEIEINPYYTDIDAINFCKKNNIQIIAYGIFCGKYKATQVIADFSIPYLMEYATNYADIVILKPECERHVNEFIDIFNNYKINKNNEYVILNLNNEIAAPNKSIVPMRYEPKSIKRVFNNIPTYNNACGKNNGKFELMEIVNINEFPVFEMLGDYMTYIRYKYRQNYDNDEIYLYDFLIGDDGFLYSIYINDNDKQSKINLYNDNKNIKIYKLKFS